MANLLANPSFEEPYTQREAPEIKVAEGWKFGYDGGFGARPELTAERMGVGSARILAGERAQKGFVTYNKCRWWLSQVVPVTKGKWYRGSVCIWGWSSEEDDPEHSQKPGKEWCRVGINPWGVVEPLSWGTQYGMALVDQYDKWVTFDVYAQAQAGQIAFVIELQNEMRAKHNDWYIDSAELVEVAAPGGVSPEPTPEPEPGEYPTLDEIEDRVRNVIRSETGHVLDWLTAGYIGAL